LFELIYYPITLLQLSINLNNLCL